MIPLAARILRALQGGPIHGQTALLEAVLGSQRTIEQCETFRIALRFHLVHPIGVVEERVQLPSTGHEGPAVFEYRYRLPTEAEAAASRALVRAPRQDHEIGETEEASD